ncbi:MAG TPA: UDP-N-acetylmuramoyl-tripeptide--D-alanyl-D-alanine ligase [Negativicutes bacterium]
MAEFTVAEVCQATKGIVVGEVSNERFTGVSTDTRTIKPGALFVALVGERFDGHNFIEQAVQKGATGLIVSQRDIQAPPKVNLFVVEDTLIAFQSLARFHRQRFTIPVVAVTGSNGKTTTKDMIAAVLSSRFNVLKTEANYNNEIGLPLTLLNLHGKHEVAVVEMGMRGSGEIHQLTTIALPTVAVVTNVGETHIELLGSLENIAAAKAELVEAIPAVGLVVLNGDNQYVRTMQSKTKARVVLYGCGQGNNIWAANIQAEGQGTKFDFCYLNKWFASFVPALGQHNVYNAMAAITIGLELGLTVEEVNAGLSTFATGAMRLKVENIGEYTVINDAYNASPLSMSAAIDTLGDVAKGRKIAVLGDMLELGHIAVEAHRRIGRKLAECGIKVVVTVGELAENIADSAREYGVNTVVACQNHEQAKVALQRLLLPGDTILIKGSRGLKMEKMVEMFL